MINSFVQIEIFIVKWLRSLTLNHLPLTAVVSLHSTRGKAIQLANGTSVVILRFPFMSERMHRGLPQTVKLKSRHMTYTVLLRRKSQPKIKF
jgi:hypothetical protein